MIDLAYCCLGKPKKKNQHVEVQSSNLQLQHNEQIDQLPSEHDQVDAQLHIQTSPSVSGEGKKRAELIDNILDKVKGQDICKVVLHGEHGVGKTWIAKEVTKRALVEDIVDVTIWLYLNKQAKHHDVHYRSIAHQLSVQLDILGADDFLEEDINGESLIVSLKRRLQKQWSLKNKPHKTKILVVLDDENSDTSVQEIESMLDKILDSGTNTAKFITTRLTVNGCDGTNTNIEYMEIKHLTASESTELFMNTYKKDQIHLTDNYVEEVEEIVKRCKYLPAAILFTGNVPDIKPGNMSRNLAMRKAKNAEDIYCCSYQKFSGNGTLLRCFWLSKVCLEEHTSINYNLLILYWILEGYFENATSLEEAYTQGHNVLMDFLDAGLLGEREVGDVVLETAGLKYWNYLFEGLCENIPFKFPAFFKGLLNNGSYVKRMNGSIAAIRTSGRSEAHRNLGKPNLNTLLVEGIDISKVSENPEIGTEFLFKGLQILSISKLELNTCCLGMCRSLRALILKGCHSVNNMENIASLSGLSILEISGTTSLEIPENFLDNFQSLESLNLSGTPIESFPRPSSTSSLSKLRSLILRECIELKCFPDVNGLEELEMLDLSGAKLKSFRKKVWYLEGVPKLKMLDLSATNIYDFPGIKKVENLTYLLVKNCPKLYKMRPVTTLTNLRVIDVSGCRNLQFFREVNLPTFGVDCLTKLDLSGTMIRKLPTLSNASNLVYLCLKNCSKLTQLPSINGAKKLRLLDVSDAIELEEFIDTSFEMLESIQEIFVSNTRIKALPCLNGLESLQKLFLNGCKSLQGLPEMDGLSNLLLLDIGGCNAALGELEELRARFVHVEVLYG